MQSIAQPATMSGLVTLLVVLTGLFKPTVLA
jgi:hypothetical protein